VSKALGRSKGNLRCKFQFSQGCLEVEESQFQGFAWRSRLRLQRVSTKEFKGIKRELKKLVKLRLFRIARTMMLQWLKDINNLKKRQTRTRKYTQGNEQVHLGAKVGEYIMETEVPGQEGGEGNVAERKKVKEV
ncbi:hypothetical protein Tco_0932309, partial [Tanacetum coccineum]